jgi:hypothetical protein
LFFFSCLWQSKLREYYRNDARAAKLKEMIRKEFNLEKPLDILTLGDLCVLLSQVNKRIKTDSSLEKEAESIFKRTYVVPSNDIRKLCFVASSRTSLTGIHPVKRTHADPKKVLAKLLEVCEDWSRINGQIAIYPIVIRVKEERKNEFGISHLIATDEKGDQWVLKKSNMWIRPENAYYMLSDTESLAIEPILIERIW